MAVKQVFAKSVANLIKTFDISEYLFAYPTSFLMF